MAKIGLKYFRYAVLTEASDGTPSYDGAKTPAKAISCSVSISNNDVSLYADDAIAESDTSFQNGTVSIGIDDEDQATMATLLGHTVTTDGDMIRNVNDIAPYVGFGRVITKMVGGVLKYKVEFLYKVKFGEPSQEENTKGESLEFGTTTLEGRVASLANGDWSDTKTFTTLADALAYLEGLMASPTPTTKYTITYNANGGTGTIAPVEVTAGQSVTLSDGTGLTAPSSKTFGGWATTSTAETADVTSPYTPQANVTLYAVWSDQ